MPIQKIVSKMIEHSDSEINTFSTYWRLGSFWFQSEAVSTIEAGRAEPQQGHWMWLWGPILPLHWCWSLWRWHLCWRLRSANERRASSHMISESANESSVPFSSLSISHVIKMKEVRWFWVQGDPSLSLEFSEEGAWTALTSVMWETLLWRTSRGFGWESPSFKVG